MLGGEALTGLLDPGRTIVAAAMSGGPIGSVIYFHPLLPWMGFLMLG